MRMEDSSWRALTIIFQVSKEQCSVGMGQGNT